jgi:hypothetical protein
MSLKKILRRLVVTISVVAMAFGATAAATASSTVGSGPNSLSPTGQQAVTDLRNCLAETPILNVFYLVDASGSLFADSSEHTDPNFLRANILQNSLVQLANITTSEGEKPVTVNYSMGFFGDTYKTGIGWTNVTATTAAGQGNRMAQVIQYQSPLGSTNWQIGLSGAQKSIATQQRVQAGCSALVWFTDGGINIDGPDGPKTHQALADLCGAPLAGSTPRQGLGTFAELRQSGTEVFGVLYNISGNSGVYGPYMRPLIEGSGTVGGATLTCGGGTKEGQAAGAFIEATSASDLALVFMGMGGLIAGGSPTDLATDGSFSIDPGVTSFQIIVASDPKALSLTSPTGPVALGAPGSPCLISGLSGAAQISCTLSSPKQFGSWKLLGRNAGDYSSLLLFGGLTVQLSQDIEFLAGSPAKIAGTIGVRDKSVVTLSDYRYKLVVGTVDQKGRFAPKFEQPSSALTSGTFSFDYTATGTLASETVRASLIQVETSAHGQPLKEVSAQESIPVTLPGDYPNVVVSQQFSELKGKNDPATGKIKILGPANSGLTGQVCLPAKGFAPAIVSDASPDRANDWTWTLKDANGKQVSGCITIASGKSQEYFATASNPKSANSQVKAVATFTLKNSAGGELVRDVPITFQTSHNLNAGVFWGVLVALILAGVLLPLVVMWLVNYFSTKVEHGDGVSALSLDVQLSLDNDRILAAASPGAPFSVSPSAVPAIHEKFRPVPRQDDARVINVGLVGTFRAVVSTNPFSKPRYEIVAPAGKRIVPTSGEKPSALGGRFKAGLTAPFSGRVSTTSVLLIPETELARLTSSKPTEVTAVLPPVPGASAPVTSVNASNDRSVAATLVVFGKFGLNPTEPSLKRLREVEQYAKPSTTIAALVELARTEKQPKVQAPRTTKGPKPPKSNGASSTPAAPPLPDPMKPSSSPSNGGSTLPPPPRI